MGMVFCRGCGKEIHETAPVCPHCGAPQNIPSNQGNGKYTHYSQVPWYRKNWFTVICVLFFPPGLLLPLLTGDVYYERKGQLKTYSRFSKIFIIIWSVAVIFMLFTKLSSTELFSERQSCSNTETQALVKSILVDALAEVEALFPSSAVKQAGGIKSLNSEQINNNLVLTNIRVSGYDEKIKKYSCEATLEISHKIQLPISYTSQLNDIDELFSEIDTSHISGNDFRIMLSTISESISQSDQIKTETTNKTVVTEPQPLLPVTSNNSSAVDQKTIETEQTPSNVTPKTDADEESVLCKDLDLSVIVDQAECVNRKYTHVDKQLNDVYKQVMAKLDESRKATLKNEQIAWIQKKESECGKAAKEYEGGTLEPIVETDCEVKMTNEQLIYLEKFK